MILDGRLIEIETTAQTLAHRISDETAARTKTAAEINDQLRAVIAKQDEDQRQRTIRGLRWEATGFVVITLGAILQGWGSVAGALPTSVP